MKKISLSLAIILSLGSLSSAQVFKSASISEQKRTKTIIHESAAAPLSNAERSVNSAHDAKDFGFEKPMELNEENFESDSDSDSVPKGVKTAFKVLGYTLGGAALLYGLLIIAIVAGGGVGC